MKALTLAVLWLWSIAQAHSADITGRVLDADGRPVSEYSVLVKERFQQVTALRRGGELPPPPSPRIVHRRGRTVRVEKFHYG